MGLPYRRTCHLPRNCYAWDPKRCPLIYYIALYLPSALVGKWTHSTILSSGLLYGTLAAALAIFFAWLIVQFPKAKWYLPLFLYLAFSGQKLMGWWWWSHQTPFLG